MASTYLSITPGAGSQKKATWSAWVKKSAVGAAHVWGAWSDATHFLFLDWQSSSNFLFRGKTSSYVIELETDAEYKDVNGWYHIVANVDTTESVEADRATIWINGVEQTSLSLSNYPALNSDLDFNTASHTTYIGRGGGSPESSYLDGYMAQFTFVDGTAYPASTFGATDASTGEWKPKGDASIRAAVTFGTNGYLLPFSNASYLGYDYQTSDRSGTTNDFAKSGDGYQSQDNPSNVFCTGNLLNWQTSYMMTLNQGGNTITGDTDSTWRTNYGTVGNTLGKYYYEAKCIALGTAANVGVCNLTTQIYDGWTSDNYVGSAGGWGYDNGGHKLNNDSATSGYGDTWTTGDIIGVAFDVTGGNIWFSKNGVWQNSATIGEIAAGTTTNAAFTGMDTTTLMSPATAYYVSTKWGYNFGNGYFSATQITSEGTNASGIGKFEYDVPTGYTAWSTKGFNE